MPVLLHSLDWHPGCSSTSSCKYQRPKAGRYGLPSEFHASGACNSILDLPLIRALHVCVSAQCRKSSLRCGVIRWQGPDKLKFTVKASYLELYKEVITDLLGPADGASLQLREDLCNGVYVEGLTEQEILNGALPWAEQSPLGAPSLVESRGDFFFQRRL